MSPLRKIVKRVPRRGCGFVPSPFMTVYVATKHAVEGYSQSLDHEVRGGTWSCRVGVTIGIVALTRRGAFSVPATVPPGRPGRGG
jgi:short-subunit dehydrogenase